MRNRASLGVTFVIILSAYVACGGDDDGAEPPANDAGLDVATSDVRGDTTTATDAANDTNLSSDTSIGTDANGDAGGDASNDAVADAPTDANGDANNDADAADGGGPGCADGTRDGLEAATYPNVAACAGAWVGDVANAAALCEAGWHVCDGSEAALTAVAYADAIAAVGCYAINAAQDNNVCLPGCAARVDAGVDTAANIDMGAIGSTCPFKYPSATSCITGGRIDFSENTGTGCNFAVGLTGAVCCKN